MEKIVFHGNYAEIGKTGYAFHPGYYISEIVEYGDATKEEISRKSGIPMPQLERIMAGKEDVTEEIAQKIARFMCSSSQYWMNLQHTYDRKIHRGKRGHKNG